MDAEPGYVAHPIPHTQEPCLCRPIASIDTIFHVPEGNGKLLGVQPGESLRETLTGNSREVEPAGPDNP